jgi:hypothetical protein
MALEMRMNAITLSISFHLAPPKVDVFSEGKVVQFKMNINCSVKSSSTPTICWYRNNDLVKCNTYNLTSGHNQHYWNNIIADYPTTNENYTCTAENAYGKASESYIIPCIAGKMILVTFSTINIALHSNAP